MANDHRKLEKELAQEILLTDPAFGHEVPTPLYMIAVCTNGEPLGPLRQPLLILDRDRQIYEEHARWHAVLGQLLTYHNYKQRILSSHLQEANKRLRQRGQRLQQTNKRLERQDKLLRESQREMNAMRNSRGWKIADKINAATSGMRRILRGG